MFKNTKIVGYAIFALMGLLVILLLWSLTSKNLSSLTLGVMFLLFIFFNLLGDPIGIASALIRLNLYVGDKIAIYSEEDEYREEVEEYFISRIGLFRVELNRGDIVENVSWTTFLFDPIKFPYSIEFLDTKAHPNAPLPKRTLRETFYLKAESSEDIKKLQPFMEELQKELKKEKLLSNVYVGFVHSGKNLSPLVRRRLIEVKADVEIGRENFYQAKTAINEIFAGLNATFSKR